MAAVKKGTGLDRAAQIISVLGSRCPPSGWQFYWWSSCGRLQWLPPGVSGFSSYVLPGFTLGWFVVAGLMRLLRSGMLEVLDRST